MMRLYVLGLTLIIGISLLLPGCNGPADSKDPQRWWNAKVSEKDTAGVYVQVFDRNTGALTGKHKLAAGAQVRIVFDSSAKAGSKVNLCRASMVYFMDNNQLMSGTLDQSSQLILMDQNVEFPPGDPSVCALHEYIGNQYIPDGGMSAPIMITRADLSPGATAPIAEPLAPGSNFWFSDCYDHPVGSVIRLERHHLIWVELTPGGLGRIPCIIESPMDVTISGRLGW